MQRGTASSVEGRSMLSAFVALRLITGSGVWHPPPKYRNAEASDQGNCLEAEQYPVSDRCAVSMNKPIRPVREQPLQKISVAVPDFSLDKGIPQRTETNDAQIDCDDASDDFIKEKLHSVLIR
jgi:hypothetical protein